MKTDPIVEEVHKAREAIAARFGGDLRAICEDAKARLAACGRPARSMPPRPAPPAPAKAG